ncbi:hypothetical protein RZS08_05210, partial [Arthrospira platensis SPKY1]|nr:hypothetical protein [Arthrospira platensis SPKY1]
DQRIAFRTDHQSGDNRRFALRMDTTDERYVWARVGDSGAVVAAATIRGLEIATLSSSGMFLGQTYDDGVDVIIMPIVASHVAPDMRIELEIFVAGVLFENGTTDTILLPEHFDDTG